MLHTSFVSKAPKSLHPPIPSMRESQPSPEGFMWVITVALLQRERKWLHSSLDTLGPKNCNPKKSLP